MITFWILAAAMVAIALVFLFRPLRLDSNKSDVDRTAQNIAITKERLNELKLEFEQNTINEEEYRKTREELEQALLNDVEQPVSEEIKQTASASNNRITRFALMFTVPALAVSLYAYLGRAELIDGARQQVAAPASNRAAKLGTIEEMVEKLATKMKDNPDNAEGWFMLGRSYMSLKKYKEAVDALEKTNQLVPNNPVIMLQYADALTMLRGGQIRGKPFELIKRAVEIKPDDPTGLWLLGMGYEEQGEYQKAISYWNLLLPLLKDERSTSEVKNLIRQAKSKAGINLSETTPAEVAKTNKQSAAVSLKVKVELDQKMNSQVSANDTVFIFAKAVSGPPMPLAVVRKQVKDLPLQVTLDDSMAMVPDMKLSSFDKVQLIARVSKSGKPLLQAGDLYSKEKIIKLPFNDVITVKIDLLAR